MLLPKRLSIISRLLERLQGQKRWKDEWKKQLSEKLERAQEKLNVTFVTVISNESDLYFECLFLLSFIGVGLGTLLSLVLEPPIDNPKDLLTFPLLGFCVGSILYHLRRHYIHWIAPRAIRARVSLKAKAIFYDHYISTNQPFVMLYISELEREALFLATTELNENMPETKVSKVLHKLCLNYNAKEPMPSVSLAIEELSTILPMAFEGIEIKNILNQGKGPLYFMNSGSKENPLPIAVIRGGKDIN